MRSVRGERFVIPNECAFGIPNGSDFGIPNGSDFVIPNECGFVIPNGSDFVIPNESDFVIPNECEESSSFDSAQDDRSFGSKRSDLKADAMLSGSERAWSCHSERM